MAAPRPRTLAAALTLIATVLAAGPAQAAYPGANGRIAFLERTGVRGDNSGMAFVRSVGPSGGSLQTHEPCVAACRLMGTPAWSRHVSRLAFAVPDTVVSENPAGGDQQQATEKSLYAYEPAWGPQGSLVFTFHPGDAGAEQPDLYIRAIVGITGASRRLTFGRGRQAAWSLTDRIAFVRGGSVNQPNRGEIYIVRSDGVNLRRLTYLGGAEPAWSPYATKIAFRRHSDIYIVGSDGRGLRRLTYAGGSQPAWSPDGQRIAFVRGGDIWTVRTNGTALVRVFDSNAALGFHADEPDWGRAP